MTGRNGLIDLQKFFYAWIVVILHFYISTYEHLVGGGAAVEFFVVVSGAFFCAGYQRNKVRLSEHELVDYPVVYIKKRLLRFLPYTVPAFILGFFVKEVISADGMGFNSVSYIMHSFAKHIWDIPLLSMCGVNGGGGYDQWSYVDTQRNVNC